jgi:hypothetical protein
MLAAPELMITNFGLVAALRSGSVAWKRRRGVRLFVRVAVPDTGFDRRGILADCVVVVV